MIHHEKDTCIGTLPLACAAALSIDIRESACSPDTQSNRQPQAPAAPDFCRIFCISQQSLLKRQPDAEQPLPNQRKRFADSALQQRRYAVLPPYKAHYLHALPKFGLLHLHERNA